MRPQRPQMVGDQERECGSCTACCTWLRIDSRIGYSTRLDTGEDIAKPAGTSCIYLGAQGCTIYHVRPVVCRRFLCDWRMKTKGYEKEDDAPLTSRKIGIRGSTVEILETTPIAR